MIKLVEWRDWVIVGLWSIALILGGLGFASIKDSITTLQKNDIQQAELLQTWRIENDRRTTVILRLLDVVCSNQNERLLKEGKPPIYRPTP